MTQVDNISKKIIEAFYKYGHDAHRLSLGLVFIWYGLLKPFGAKTTTSLLAHTIYFFPPETLLPILGWWEVAIGITLIFKPISQLFNNIAICQNTRNSFSLLYAP